MGMLDETVALLERDKGSWPETAKATGLDREWMAKLSGGKIGDPGFKKIEKLYCYLKAKYQNEAAA